MFYQLYPARKLEKMLCGPGVRRSGPAVRALARKDPVRLKAILGAIAIAPAGDLAIKALGGMETLDAKAFSAILQNVRLCASTRIQAAQRLAKMDMDQLRTVVSSLPEDKEHVKDEARLALGEYRKLAERIMREPMERVCPDCGGKVEERDRGGEYWNGDHSCGWVEDWRHICDRCGRDSDYDFSEPLYDEVIKYESC